MIKHQCILLHKIMIFRQFHHYILSQQMSFKEKAFLKYLVVLMAILGEISCVTFPTVTYNNHFIIGSYTVDTFAFFGRTTNIFNFYSCTFLSPRTTNAYKISLSIQNFNFLQTGGGGSSYSIIANVEGKLPINFQFSLQSAMADGLQVFQILYLLVDNTISEITVDTINSISNTLGYVASSSNPPLIVTKSLTTTINNASPIFSFVTLIGFNFNTITELSFNPTITLSLSGGVTLVTISIVSTSVATYTIDYVSFTFIAFNKADVRSLGENFLTGVLDSTTNTNNFQESSGLITSNNMFFGVTSFGLTSGTNIGWYALIVLSSTPATLNIDHTTYVTMTALSLTYVLFKFVPLCTLQPDLYLYQNNSCVSLCPNRYYPDTSTFICTPCLYHCYTCTSNTQCLSCSSASDRRVLDATTNRCVALRGYFDDGVNANTLPCTYPCSTCQNTAMYCLACADGFSFVSTNNTCINSGSTSSSINSNSTSSSTNSSLISSEGLLAAIIILVVIIIALIISLILFYRQYIKKNQRFQAFADQIVREKGSRIENIQKHQNTEGLDFFGSQHVIYSPEKQNSNKQIIESNNPKSNQQITVYPETSHILTNSPRRHRRKESKHPQQKGNTGSHMLVSYVREQGVDSDGFNQYNEEIISNDEKKKEQKERFS